MFSANRFGIPSLLLSMIVGLLAYYNYEVWLQPFPQILMKETPKRAEGKTRGETPAAVPGPKEPAPAGYIQVISEKNMFSPDRKEFSSTPSGEQARPVTRPQVVLHGVLITESSQMATVVNPGRPLRKGEREGLTLKVGDRVGEYKLAKVMPDRILLEASGDSFEVLLIDPKAPKRRTEVRTTIPPVTVTSSAGIVPGAPVSPGVPPTAPGASPAPPFAVPGMAPGTLPRPIMPTPAVPSVVPRTVGPSPQMGAPGTVSGPPTPTALPDPGSYRGRRFMGPGTTPEGR